MKSLTTIKKKILVNSQLFGTIKIDLDQPELRRQNTFFTWGTLFVILLFGILFFVIPMRIVR